MCKNSQRNLRKKNHLGDMPQVSSIEYRHRTAECYSQLSIAVGYCIGNGIIIITYEMTSPQFH